MGGGLYPLLGANLSSLDCRLPEWPGIVTVHNYEYILIECKITFNSAIMSPIQASSLSSSHRGPWKKCHRHHPTGTSATWEITQSLYIYRLSKSFFQESVNSCRLWVQKKRRQVACCWIMTESWVPTELWVKRIDQQYWSSQRYVQFSHSAQSYYPYSPDDFGINLL